MNREAAIIGTPAYTVFAGHLPSVDRKLIELGRLAQLRTLESIRDLRLVKKPKQGILKNEGLVRFFVDQLERANSVVLERRTRARGWSRSRG